MKQFLFLFFSLLLISSSCRKNKAVDPLSQLPPQTQTGAETFGCLINGQVFMPGGAQLSGGSLSSNYQFLNGGYYFRLVAVRGNGSNQTSVGLFTDSLPIHEGDKLVLVNREKQKPYGLYLGTGSSISDWKYETSIIYNGELWIKKLDSVNQIVAGTFWFNAVNEKGDTVKITDGRFDVHYTL
jgi:hypothetical protein